MQESIQFDFRGEMHFDFERDSLVFITPRHFRFGISACIGTRRVVTNTSLRYQDIQWIGCIIRRQWWLLVPGIPFTLLGPVGAISCFGDWGPFTMSILWSFVLGIFPLFLLIKGRRFLGIATTGQIIVIPMDRRRKKIARILGLLKQSCQSAELRWDLNGTPFHSQESWDNRPASGIGYNWKRFYRISAIISLYGLANLLRMSQQFQPLAAVILVIIGGIILEWVFQVLRSKLMGNQDE